MLMQKPDPEMIAEWKETFREYQPLLPPNRKPASELLLYLQQKYPVTELYDETMRQVVEQNVLENDCHAGKLPAGKSPSARVFLVENTGAGKSLYENQDELFRGTKIFVGIEMETGFFLVEGSSRLWDELFAYQGLDEEDLKIFYLVAEYVACRKKAGTLEEILVKNE